MQFGHNDSSPVNNSRARGTIRGNGDETEEIDNQTFSPENTKPCTATGGISGPISKISKRPHPLRKRGHPGECKNGSPEPSGSGGLCISISELLAGGASRVVDRFCWQQSSTEEYSVSEARARLLLRLYFADPNPRERSQSMARSVQVPMLDPGLARTP